MIHLGTSIQRLHSRLEALREQLRGRWSVRWQAGQVILQGTLRLGRRNIFRVEAGGVLEIQGALRTDRDVEIVVYNGGRLTIGENVYIGHGTTIACAQRITIGEHSMLADLLSIRDMNHCRQPGKILAESGMQTRPIAIGANCWLGSKATVIAGAVLEDNVTVGANAVVTGHIPAGTTAVGIPARVLPEADAGEPGR